MCAFIQEGFKGPWKAVEGGIHFIVFLPYHWSPNVHAKCVLYSKSDWLAYGYLTHYTLGIKIEDENGAQIRVLSPSLIADILVPI